MAAVNFQEWFPQYRLLFQQAIQGPCHDTFNAYIYGTPSDRCPGGSCYEAAGQVVDCLLENAGEALKANMAAAAVFHRPMLAAVLATGAQSVTLTGMFDYDDPTNLLRKNMSDHFVLPAFAKTAPTLLLLGEYLLAVAAVANLGQLSYLLCVQTVCSFAIRSAFHPALWASLALALHGWRAMVVKLRLLQHPRPRPAPQGGRDITALRSCWRRWTIPQLIANKFQHIYWSSKGKLLLEIRPASTLFICCNWLTWLFTLGHVLHGTVVFSSILFVSSRDAVVVVFRFLTSAVVCRVILLFELSQMQKKMELVDPSRGEAS